VGVRIAWEGLTFFPAQKMPFYFIIIPSLRVCKNPFQKTYQQNYNVKEFQGWLNCISLF